MDEYLIYLRKSRADRDAEARGEGETLARHEKALLALANKLQLNITGIYREIVSGETIAARPEVQKLLERIENESVKGVLVMEIERLARGDTSDQGLIASAFKDNNVKIITPTKTFDPNNEFDEEYFEFNLFMSRREYKTINRRIQRGRIASVQEGKFIGSTAPYGYEKVRITDGKGFTLKIIPEEAEIVQKIFEWYTKGKLDNNTYHTMGTYTIATELDKLGIKPRVSEHWSRASISDMLKNPTYIGKIRWSYRVKSKKKKGTAATVLNDDYILVDGLHEAIIDEQTFYKAADILRNHTNPTLPSSHTLKNPFTGLVYCAKCGKLMNRAASNTKTRYDVIFCSNKYCKNVSAPLSLVEEKLINSLKTWIKQYDVPWNSEPTMDNDFYIKQAAISKLQAEQSTLKKQLENTYDLLERGVYSSEVFLERNQLLMQKLDAGNQKIAELEKECEVLSENTSIIENFIPKVQNLVETYLTLDSPAVKNNLLKEILTRIEYEKDTANTKGKRDIANFSLKLYPKLPK